MVSQRPDIAGFAVKLIARSGDMQENGWPISTRTAKVV